MGALLGRLTDAVLSRRRTVLVAWLVLCLLGAVLAAGLPSRIVPGGEAPSSSQSEVVARALADSGLPSLFLTVEVDRASPAALRRATAEAGAAAATVPGVTRVTPLPDPPGGPGRTARIAVLSLSTTGGTDGAIEVARRLDQRRDALTPDGATVFVGGFGAYRAQLTELSRSDLKRAERVGLPIVFLVLLLTFGSLWAAALPLAIALGSLLLGLGAVGAFSYVLPMSDFVTNAASMIGIALGVDYAMFLLRRVRELTLTGAGTDDAIRTAMTTTGTAVLWSGVTVLAAEATLLLVDSRSIRSAAFGMVLVTLFAILTALVVAPVVISLLGSRVTRTRRTSSGTGSTWWERWARRVTRRGPLWLAGGAVVMIALAIPAAGLQESVNVSGASTLPADASVRQAYTVAAQRYGPAALSPLTVLVAPQDRAALPGLITGISADERVAAVRRQALPDGSVVLGVTSRAGPHEPASRELVAALRDGSLSRTALLVGGETASGMDATEAMFASLPEVGIVLLLVIAALLVCALRSVLLPVKAVVLVVLSLGSSLGGLLLLTTTELGSRLIGADGPGDIHPIVPVTILAITMALSTDYEVLLLSRIGEHFRRTGDSRESIVAGVAHTGGVITSAAVIMVAVFLGFALADLPPLKQLGVGLALAVLLDATLVRGVLVPAAMAVMGRANWWWPGHALPTALPTQRAAPAVAKVDA